MRMYSYAFLMPFTLKFFNFEILMLDQHFNLNHCQGLADLDTVSLRASQIKFVIST